MNMISFNLHNKSVKWILLLATFLKQEHRNLAGLNIALKVTYPVPGEDACSLGKVNSTGG